METERERRAVGAREIDLGGFVLRERIGRGGMGEVWRAVHRRRGLDAAVKIVTRRHRAFAAGLEAEIRAAATLHHPNVARLYDTGRVDAAAAAASQNTLSEGHPWLAMALVEGGELTLPARDDATFRRVIGQLLDALAHAHARGFVHCDLKPENVLLDRDGNVVLTDFGMARTTDRSRRDAGLSGGTPLWMAPEQFLRDEPSIGPWTDLYALGCLAWALLAGRPPYDEGGLSGLKRAHLHAPLPPLDVSPSLRAWLERCAAKDPRERFRRAADAARALLGRPTAEPDPPVLRPAELGLGLLRHREPPLVGRASARDALTDALQRAGRGEPAAVVLRGPAGCGKSALAKWICQLAHVSGEAEVVRVAVEGGADLAREAVTLATRAHLAANVDQQLERLGIPDRDAVRELLDAPAEPTLLTSPERRLDVALAALRACAGDRVLLLWVDDAHLQAEGPALAARALEGQGRVFVVLSVRDDVLVDFPEAAGALDALAARPDVRSVDVGPLMPDDLLALLERAVPLRPDLADTVVARAEGVPLFALQLVADWIDRAVLTPRGARWALAGEVALPVPVSIERIWLDRVRSALDGAPPSWRTALEVAAALGRDVDRDEWHDATALLSLRGPPPGLVERLVERGLAHADVETPRRWRFVHGLLPVSILSEARDPRSIHLACAEILRRRGVARAGRRAAHLERADRLEEALDAWREATSWLRTRDLAAAVAAARRGASVAARLGPRAEAAAWLLVSRMERMRAHDPGWILALDRAEVAMDGQDYPDLRAEALASRGWLRSQERRLDEARALGRQAAELLPRIQVGERFEVLSSLGILLLLAWDNEAAIPVLRAAADEAPTELLRGQKLTFLAWSLAATKDLAGAVAAIDAAEPLCREALPARAQWCFTAAGVRGEQGERRVAIELMKEAVEAKIELGADPSAWMTQLAGHQCAAGEADAADATLARLAPADAEGPTPRALRVRIAAVRGDDEALDVALERLGTVDPKRLGLGTSRWLEEAGDRVAPRRPDLARRCWRVARIPAENFGAAENVSRLDAKLSGAVRFEQP